MSTLGVVMGATDGSEPWAVGDVVAGRYDVREVAGVGGMGQVLRVRHLEWGVDLAVKSPKAEWFGTAKRRAEFAAEAEMWVSLGLPLTGPGEVDLRQYTVSAPARYLVTADVSYEPPPENFSPNVSERRGDRFAFQIPVFTDQDPSRMGNTGTVSSATGVRRRRRRERVVQTRSGRGGSPPAPARRCRRPVPARSGGLRPGRA